MPINEAPPVHQLVICANVFLRQDGRYLMLERSANKRFAPGVVHPIGGKLEANENPLAGAKRELREEAGVEGKNFRLEAVILEVVPHPQAMPYNWLIFHFSADYAGGHLTPTAEGKFVWLRPKDFPRQKLLPSVRQVIADILNPKTGTVFATFTYDAKGEIVGAAKRIATCIT